jgi:hypothetical protein
MPIAVICPGCKTNFRVNEKFAGQKGPCPKCKTIVVIPEAEEVKIHAPEEFESGGKDSKGRPSAKPILREETKISPVQIGAMIGGTIAVLAVTFFARTFIKDLLALKAIGVLAVSIPLAAGGYAILRDDELEPYRGGAMWLRAAICGVAYSLLWGGFFLALNYVPADIKATPWIWLFIVPPFFLVGAGVSAGALDLDYGSGVFHFGLFALASLALYALLGGPYFWQAPPPPPRQLPSRRAETFHAAPSQIARSGGASDDLVSSRLFDQLTQPLRVRGAAGAARISHPAADVLLSPPVVYFAERGHCLQHVVVGLLIRERPDRGHALHFFDQVAVL